MIKHYRSLFPAPAPYVEPFCGGAAVFAHLHTWPRQGMKVCLGDSNAELIGLYRVLASDVEGLIGQVEPRSSAWADRSPSDRKRLYYDWRQEYWDMPDGLEATGLLYALMRTSFNGIWQTCAQSRGRFATPVGLTHKPGGFLDPQALRTWAKALAGVGLHAGTYADIEVPRGAFVFCDPPYRDSFTHYSTGFNDVDQEALIAWCRDIHHHLGATVWLANREAGDGFFQDRVGDARILRFPVTYTAGRRKRTQDGFEAKPATELLMIWE